jgi:hypothetical protein
MEAPTRIGESPTQFVQLLKLPEGLPSTQRRASVSMGPKAASSVTKHPVRNRCIEIVNRDGKAEE